MKKQSKYVEELRRIRSLLVASSLKKRQDIKALQLIKNNRRKLKWRPLEHLNISNDAWDYIKKLNYNPELVFCHPEILQFYPRTSLYYRGLSGLSIKAAKSYFGSIESLESGRDKISLSKEKALLMAKTYNSFICAIVKNVKNWKLDDGHRCIVANMGITLDGAMRNKIGRLAEEKIKIALLEWMIEEKLILYPKIKLTNVESEDLPKTFKLKKDITMKFGTEPDISFAKEDKLLAVVEIKGGTDPAGALERYGAATKSFQNALKNSHRCKNFYLGAVFTEELIKRMDNDRLVESRWDIVKLLEEPGKREVFFKELFHYGLRII